jgi:hypothetical protein
VFQSWEVLASYSVVISNFAGNWNAADASDSVWQTVSQSKICEWDHRLKDGCESLGDNPDCRWYETR